MVKFIPYTTARGNQVYLNARHVFSYGTRNVILISGRGGGKTFIAKRYVTPRFMYRGEQFAWIRDNDEARRRLAENKGSRFFADYDKMPEKIARHKSEFSIEGKTILYGDKDMGYLLPANAFQNDKGSSYDKVTTVVFDEFIAEHSRNQDRHRLWKIINTLSTIMRDRAHGKLLFLANALDRSDPLLALFGFDKIKDYGIYVNREKDVALQYFDTSPARREQVDKSIVGKILKGSAYEKNMIDGEFLDINIDGELFLELPPRASYCYALCLGNEKVAVYAKDGTIYIAGELSVPAGDDRHYVRLYSDVYGVRRMIAPDLLELLRLRHSAGRIKFISPHARNFFLEFIKIS